MLGLTLTLLGVRPEPVLLGRQMLQFEFGLRPTIPGWWLTPRFHLSRRATTSITLSHGAEPSVRFEA